MITIDGADVETSELLLGDASTGRTVDVAIAVIMRDMYGRWSRNLSLLQLAARLRRTSRCV